VSTVIINTLNSTYVFDVGDWNTTVHGGIIGDSPKGCLAPDIIRHARDSGDLVDLIGAPLVFQANDLGTYTDPIWERVRTSVVVDVMVTHAPLRITVAR
jgi:hypothetical protein